MLIQKSIKQKEESTWETSCLRALLIQKSIKPCIFRYYIKFMFESFVNSEEYQTDSPASRCSFLFESFVNSEEYQTRKGERWTIWQFESFVNSEEYQTKKLDHCMIFVFESFVNSEEYQTLLQI